MVKQSKGRSRPIPDATKLIPIILKLQEALSNENQFVCNYADRKPWEVTTSARDGAVHVIRFLKMWFDLPQNVFFTAVSYLDMFLARMKVQEKYLSCLTVSCFHLAATHYQFVISASQLVTLSQSNCSVKDMQRMSMIITQKLNLREIDHSNFFNLLEVYMDIFKYIAAQCRIEGLLNRMLQVQHLCTRLEVLISDSSCACFKPSILVLAFLHFETERFLSNEIPRKSNYCTTEMFYVFAVMIELRTVCDIDSDHYTSCFKAISEVLKQYDSQKKTRHHQKLAWKFSMTTYALAKYTQDYFLLNTIAE